MDKINYLNLIIPELAQSKCIPAKTFFPGVMPKPDQILSREYPNWHSAVVEVVMVPSPVAGDEVDYGARKNHTWRNAPFSVNREYPRARHPRKMHVLLGLVNRAICVHPKHARQGAAGWVG